MRLTLLTALLLGPLAALHTTFGKLRAVFFQAMENHGTQTSNEWK